VLFNPVLRFGPQMLAKVNDDEVVGKAISPVLYLSKEAPPTLILFGTDDFLYQQGVEFMQRSKELGSHAEIYVAEKQQHGFFNQSPWYEKTVYRADQFLASLGYIRGEPTIKIPDASKIPDANKGPETRETPPVNASPPQIAPTRENVKYGPHERNVLDFWKAR
jgi:hypothetical protein